MLENSPAQIFIVGDRKQPDTAALVVAARKHFAQGQIIALIEPGAPDNFLTKRNPRLAQLEQLGGAATAHVCRDFSCKSPTSDPAELHRQLGGE